ncbi:hypothetical protein AA0472_2584 [Acetobacter estunensis NRIC 0472]|uniref:Uncharacterized protein n=1 Tax=Acetobacter estunensis TaxID=104097 RepID=A0A967B7M1_9PROT|nr:hypothetical protein [Acetobacter estunensis]NHO55392.1 hypothetical protein [Acetobacter estunensis]GBQ28109.1 hypothetical protein AA0472_2584 [Acetobacter estunensis NRIC 0472]
MLMKRAILALGIVLCLGGFTLMQYEEIFGLPLLAAMFVCIAMCSVLGAAFVRTWAADE